MKIDEKRLGGCTYKTQQRRKARSYFTSKTTIIFCYDHKHVFAL